MIFSIHVQRMVRTAFSEGNMHTYMHTTAHVLHALTAMAVFSPSDNCNSGDIRLVDQTTELLPTGAGRVEMCIKGNWGTICGQDWGQEEAVVVCNQLGLNSSCMISDKT